MESFRLLKGELGVAGFLIEPRVFWFYGFWDLGFRRRLCSSMHESFFNSQVPYCEVRIRRILGFRILSESPFFSKLLCGAGLFFLPGFFREGGLKMTQYSKNAKFMAVVVGRVIHL